ncbi:MAG: adenosylmethionine decarboxylase [Deltaproteobacteria bacterium]|nr:adenosylmethionine decarboxylase [Deltaproteobacteria bacterium]
MGLIAPGALGKHVLVEYHGCDAATLDDRARLREVLLEAVARSGARIITDVFHQFSPQGVTGVVVIAESHVSIHTWPEHGYAAVDIFSCSDRMDTAVVVEGVRAGLGSASVQVRELARGQLDEKLPDVAPPRPPFAAL